MSDLEKILEDQKLRLKRIRERVHNLTESIHMRKSGISAELFSSSKDKMSEFSPTVFSEIQNLLLEEITKGYEAIVKEKEKIIQQLQKDIEDISLKYLQLDSTIKEQIAKISVLSAEKEKSVADLLKKTVEINKDCPEDETKVEKKVFKTDQKNIIKTNFDFSYQIVSEADRFFRTRKGVIEEALNIVKIELNDHPSCKRVIFICEEISRIIDIFSKFKEVLKIPELNLQKVKLSDIIEETLNKILYDLRDKNVSIIKEFLQDVLYTTADKNVLMEILREIFLNSVESFVGNNNNKIVIKLLKDGNVIKLKIIDNGHGIPEHLLPKVFNIFFTTKVNTNHFGLGLFKAYWFIKMFDGDINIKSFYGQGTEVEIKFVCSEEEDRK